MKQPEQDGRPQFCRLLLLADECEMWVSKTVKAELPYNQIGFNWYLVISKGTGKVRGPSRAKTGGS